MMKNKGNIKRAAAVLLAAVMALCSSACQSGKKTADEGIPESSGGKDIVRSAAADDVFSLNSNSNYSLNPLIATNHSNQLVCNLVYENMVELDNSFNVIPNIITGWECSEDAKLWTFKLDTTHTFHDGTAVTGKDLRYSLDRAITADRFSGRFSSYKGASYTDDTLQVSLGIGDAQFVKLLNIPVIKSGTYNDAHPMGSGPYAYSEDGTYLTAYPGYAGYATVPTDTIYLKEYPTADGTISAFEDSLIDVVINDPSSYTNLGYSSTNEIHTFATTDMHYVAFNEEGMLGQNNSFRVAMQYAFDRENLVELLGGNAVASALPMYPSCDIYPQATADAVRYNLETCKNILENAGIKDYDDDGLMEYMSGTPQSISLVFIVCSDRSAKSSVARRFQSDMASIGLTVDVQELTWENYIAALDEGKFDMYYGEVKLRNNFDLTELLQVRDDDEKSKTYNAGTNMNFTNSRDSTFEKYINDYLAAGDTGRAMAYQTLCEYLTTYTGSFITIGFEKQQIITHRGVVKGVDANFGNPLYNFANWTIDMG